MKRIGVLTSGGDAPGMNAAIRAVVRKAVGAGIEVVGFKKGYNGLINKNFKNLGSLSVTGILGTGGTMLKTDRCREFMTNEGRAKAVRVCKELEIEGLVGIGGDGTFKGLLALAGLGVACVGVPGTIDNDIPSTDYSIGFDTATNMALWMLDSLRDTVKSHDRCMVVEVMGRGSGEIALTTAIASGATYVLLPGDDPEESKRGLIFKLKKSIAMGADHFLVVVAEGYSHKEKLTEIIEKETGYGARMSVLGYAQRGGVPTAQDRLIASQMGARAVELLRAKKINRAVGIKEGKVVDVDLKGSLGEKKEKKNDLGRAKLVGELSG